MMTDNQKEQRNNPFTQISLEKQTMLASPRPPSIEQLQRDAAYYKAQQLLLSMLDSGLISISEYNKITLLNRKTFSPYLVEIMPDITG